MLLPKINPDGSMTVVNVRETHCAELLHDIGKMHRLVTAHGTADGVRGILAYYDGIDYEILIKPIFPKGE